MNVGYCTNIHSGASFAQALHNLQHFAVPVKQRCSPDQSMGIGLWFSRAAVTEALEDGNWQRLRELLDEHQLVAHTFNAFPFSDFHQPVVKHRVYQPDWTTPDRLNYTLDVARLQSKLLPSGSTGTISTLPLGWASSSQDSFFSRCATTLSRCAGQMLWLAEETDVRIRLCLEPEPGCALQTSDQVVQLFQEYLLADPDSRVVNRSVLAVCHDVCHAAVMFESQQDVLSRYQEAGIDVGKVQISCAPELRRASGESGNPFEPFVEPRYLHQTTIRCRNETRFFEDLPQAIESGRQPPGDAIWRTHFHVPVMLQQIGQELRTTRETIGECLSWFIDANCPGHFEVETYAWEVAPQAIQGGTMIDSICSELTWVQSEFPRLADLNRLP